MKQITITVPDNCELKQDGNTYTIVEKEKKVTYEDVSKKLFGNRTCFYVNTIGEIVEATRIVLDVSEPPNNCTSKKQAEKLLAINKLMNVAKYLNGDWQPDWDYRHEKKYYISVDNEQIKINFLTDLHCSVIYFKSEELVRKAIEILGEETIRLALCTDY